MRCVVLESPYAASSRWRIVAFFQRWRNRRYARAAVRDSLLRGEAPIASHLLYTQPGILRDADPVERQRGIAAGLTWLTVAEATVAYIDYGVSRGMRYGIEAAQRAGVKVEYRRLGQPIDKEKCDVPNPRRSEPGAPKVNCAFQGSKL
jgi:hypothetical protein